MTKKIMTLVCLATALSEHKSISVCNSLRICDSSGLRCLNYQQTFSVSDVLGQQRYGMRRKKTFWGTLRVRNSFFFFFKRLQKRAPESLLNWTHPRSPSCVRPQKEPKPWWIKSTNWPRSISCHRVSLKARFFEATSIWGLKIGSQSALLCPHFVCLFISCRLCIMQSIFFGRPFFIIPVLVCTLLHCSNTLVNQAQMSALEWQR